MSLRDATVRLLDDWLARTQHSARVPSLSVAVARQGTTLWTGAVGHVRPGGNPVTAMTRYRIGSITKPIVAIAVLRLVDEGRLDRSQVVDLGDIVRGITPGRESDDDIFWFSIGGMPVEDISWGTVVYRRAAELGIGTKLKLWDAPALA